MKNAIKIVCLVLAILAVIPLLASCGDAKTTTDETKAKVEDETNEEVDYPVFQKETVTCLCWSDSNFPEFYEESDEVEASVMGKPVDQNTYARLQTVEDNLNVIFDFDSVVKDKFVSTAINSENNDNPYTIYADYALDACLLLSNGCLTDLKKMDYMDFDEACWPEKLTKECTVFGKQYFCTGDISVNLMFMATLIFYNKKIYNDSGLSDVISQTYGCKDIYDLVKSKKWTYDALITLSKNIYYDNNSNELCDSEDTYGFGTYGDELKAFYWGANLTTVTSDEENGFSVSSDFTNVSKISNILSKIGSFLSNSGDAILLENHVASRDAFKDGRLLFNMAPASHAQKAFTDITDFKYGVLPVPLYDTNQTEYSAISSNPYTMYGISRNASETMKEIGSAFLQRLAEVSTETTREAIFEVSMKYKFSELEEDSEMWYIIADAQTYDPGMIFAKQIGASDTEMLTLTLFQKQIQDNSSNWSGVLTANISPIRQYLSQLNTTLSALDN